MMYVIGILGMICLTFGLAFVLGSAGAAWVTGTWDKDVTRMVVFGGLLLGVAIGLLSFVIPASLELGRLQEEFTAICESRGGVVGNDKCFIDGQEVDVEKGED